jgi:arsenite methyltransferase
LNSEKDLKEIVRKKYGEIAAGGGCCGDAVSSCCGPDIGLDISDRYEDLEGYNADADLSLGCGMPTATAGISAGDTVLDLGSGAGNDVFVALSQVGQNGRVIGLDMVPEMVAKARANAERLGHTNVEFILGDIEDMPLPDATVDVVISNCVLNLVPDKRRAFAEIFRVLRPGGHFSISDVVLQGQLPAAAAEAAALYVGCVAGALQKQEYLDIIAAAGFQDVVIHKTKPITLPDSLLQEVLGPDGANQLSESGVGIFSVTVGAVRPAQ